MRFVTEVVNNPRPTCRTRFPAQKKDEKTSIIEKRHYLFAFGKYASDVSCAYNG